MHPLLLSAVLLSVAPSLASDEKPLPALPGVESGYSIVKPAPDPDDTPTGAGQPGTVRAGKWELTVSGYVWVQVGASSRATPRN